MTEPLGPKMLIRDSDLKTHSRIGTRSFVGYFNGPCPDDDCSGWIGSDSALSETQIPGGIRWTGVHCSACEKTFTVEQVQTENPETPDDY